MPNSDSEELREELLSLLDKQFEVLELSTCVTLTDEEQREYEVRKQRIHELFKQLARHFWSRCVTHSAMLIPVGEHVRKLEERLELLNVQRTAELWLSAIKSSPKSEL